MLSAKANMREMSLTKIDNQHLVKTLLVILAHPDDESFGPGGTLAKYAHEGVAVHYLCGTRGESGTIDSHRLDGFADAGELRAAELMCAARELKLAGVHFLGFRDSGMVGTPDNEHPESLHAAPLDEVARRIGEYIINLRPNAIVTHDQFGGYGHPDHIKLNQATLRAYEMLFGLRIDLSRWNTDDKKVALVTRVDPSAKSAAPEIAPPKLYFTTFPKGMVKFGVRVMPLFRQDPTKFGRNKDINLAQIASWDVPQTAKINTNGYEEMKARASACHASQQMPANQGNILMRMAFRRGRGVEYFSRVYPPFKMGDPPEKDLV